MRLIGGLAEKWGRGIGILSRHLINEDRVTIVLREPLPPGPCLWVGWHEFNFMAIISHRLFVRRPVTALVPGKLIGDTMRGWLKELGVATVDIAPGAEKAALRNLRRALRGGSDVLVAADGPAGPRRIAKAGSLWLAEHTGADLRAVGFAAAPAIRLPRWDRQVLPLPSARIVVVFGKSLSSWRLSDDESSMSRFVAHMNELDADAADLLKQLQANLRPDGSRSASSRLE